MSFVSCPVYTTTPYMYDVFRNIEPRSNIWSKFNGIALEIIFFCKYLIVTSEK